MDDGPVHCSKCGKFASTSSSVDQGSNETVNWRCVCGARGSFGL